jgi:hypothetical protein
MKIGPYEITKYDSRNLLLTKETQNRVTSVLIAEKMGLKMGDEYTKREEVGFYPKYEMALTRILDDKLLDISNRTDAINMRFAIKKAKEEIIEAVESWNS